MPGTESKTGKGVRRRRFPIRFKFLVALLFLVSLVVSLITFTTAQMFHEDKETYISDLVTIVSMSTAEESRSLLQGYAERLDVYARVMVRDDLPKAQKNDLLRGFFEDFPELVAVLLFRDDTEEASVFDMNLLESSGLEVERLREQAREQLARGIPGGRGSVRVANSTLSASLPTLTLLQSVDSSGSPLAIAAFVRLGELMRLSMRTRVFQVTVIDSDGIFLAHPDRTRVLSREPARLTEEALQARDAKSAAITLEYEMDGEMQVASFADVDLGGVLAGARIPKSAAYIASRALLKSLLLVALSLLMVTAVFGLIGARRLTRPVERLCEATHHIAEGRFDTRILVESNDEIGTLADSFNDMASGLKEREEALEAAQTQLIQSEKLAAFGQLGAGIAHEVKNPLAGILGCAQLSLRKVEVETNLYRNLRLIEKETKRCKTIIENLLRFARQERAVFDPTDINGVVSDAREIVNHQLEMHQVSLETDLDPDAPLIKGNGNQIQQVLMNLIMNAQQAMTGAPGTVHVRTRKLTDGSVQVQVADDGPGMSEEVQKKIFEPFFTTKPGGKGTGLGLSVSFGIIKDHGAEIEVNSAPGNGTIFTVTFPPLENDHSEVRDISDLTAGTEPAHPGV